MTTLTISTTAKREVIDITDHVTPELSGGDGLVSLLVLHTTAALTTADLDPGTDKDLLDFLDSLVPDRQWRHPHDPAHAPDHLLASLIGPNVTVPFLDGQLQLGTWQRIVLIELDGPKDRRVQVTIIKS